MPRETRARLDPLIERWNTAAPRRTPGKPNISTTRWRTAAEHEDLRYVFESALSPNTFWVELTKLDLSEGAPTLRLALGEGGRTVHAGDATAAFEEATPFAFLSATGS